MKYRIWTLAALLGLVLAGCGGSEGESSEAGGSAAASHSPLEDTLFLKTSPGEPLPVRKVKDESADDAEVLVSGRVKDFVGGFASFTLVDKSMKHCAENPEDKCPTPWDYCCVSPSDMAKNTLTVEVQRDGRLVKESLKGLGGLDHLQEVVVKGRIRRQEGGNVTILAEGIFLRR